jgi:hypothetical protein
MSLREEVLRGLLVGGIGERQTAGIKGNSARSVSTGSSSSPLLLDENLIVDSQWKTY